jgi:hypothetical protein
MVGHREGPDRRRNPHAEIDRGILRKHLHPETRAEIKRLTRKGKVSLKVEGTPEHPEIVIKVSSKTGNDTMRVMHRAQDVNVIWELGGPVMFESNELPGIRRVGNNLFYSRPIPKGGEEAARLELNRDLQTMLRKLGSRL